MQESFVDHTRQPLPAFHWLKVVARSCGHSCLFNHGDTPSIRQHGSAGGVELLLDELPGLSSQVLTIVPEVPPNPES